MENMNETHEEEVYEAPALTEIGSVHEVTLAQKRLGNDDGFTFQGTGQPIGLS